MTTQEPTFDATDIDRAKFAYHEGARILRTLQDRVCEMAYTKSPPSEDERDFMCDMMIELHQLLYNATLYTIRGFDTPDDAYRLDEVYSDGQPVVSRIYVPTDSGQHRIPASAYRSDIGEDVAHGVCVHVWRPGEGGKGGVAAGSTDTTERASRDYWKGCADLRAEGLLEWSRDARGRIVKRAGCGGRLQAVSKLTAEGIAETQQAEQMVAGDTEPDLHAGQETQRDRRGADDGHH